MKISNQKKSSIQLHPEAKEISFKHKYVIYNVFKKSILGTFDIDYFSLMIIDSNNILSIYSNCPAVEYQIISNNLWLHEDSLNHNNHVNGAFVFWDDLYSDSMNISIRREKEKLGFKFGFFIINKINDLLVIYSYATRKSNDKERYKNSQDVLTKIGDYFFSELESVHKIYTNKQPSVNKIRLIVDNTKK